MRPLVIFVVLALAGCVSPAPIDVRVECPPLRAWAAADLSALADAMASISEASPIWAMEKDWQQTRDSVRACRSAPKS